MSDPPAPVPANEAEWRLFAALVGFGRRLAPEGTLRRRILDSTLHCVVDALDWVYIRVAHQPAPEPTPIEPPTDQGPVSGPHGTINGPAAGASAHSMSLLWGWAIDTRSPSGSGVTSVRVYLDGYWKGTATYGLTRRDVSDHFGEQFTHCGWEFALDLQHAAAGPHTVQVAAHSAVTGQETTYTLPIVVEAPAQPTANVKFALFISGAPGDPKRYRCDHQAQQLELLGLTADVRVYGEVKLGEVLDRYHVFVLHRVLMSQDIAWFMQEVRRRGRVLIYDTDDLIFDLEATRYIAAFERMSERDRESFLDCIQRGRQALLRCDAVLVSTEPLREMVAQIHPRVLVSPNAVDRGMVEQAEIARGNHTRRGSEPVTLAYMSGSPTHDADFQQIADDVIWALEKYPTARLLTCGPLTLDPRFRELGARVEQLPLRPPDQLAELIATVDINLAPLEPDNPFTQSKSCIKYFEAALLGVPTIASAIPDFERTIQPGINGFLARNSYEWRNALAELLESADLRLQIGEQARQDTLRCHTTEAAGARLATTLRELLSMSADDDPLTINWMVRAPSDPGSAALRLASYLARRGHRLRLCVTQRTGASGHDVAELVDAVQMMAGPTRIESIVDCQPPAADVDVATDSVTARLVAAHGPSPARASLEQNAHAQDDTEWFRVGAEFEAALLRVAIAPRVSNYRMTAGA